MDINIDGTMDKTMDVTRTQGEMSVRGLGPGEIESLRRAANDSHDHALLELFLDAGLTVGEVHALRVGDFGPRGLAVRGRLGKVRTVRVDPKSIPTARGLLVDREPSDPLFAGASGKPVARRTNQFRLDRMATRAGLPTKLVTVRNLRRTFASMRVRELGIRDLSEWLGISPQAVARIASEPLAATREGNQAEVEDRSLSLLRGGRPRINESRDSDWFRQHQSGRSYARIAVSAGVERDVVAKAVQRFARRAPAGMG